jgi:hypothetical protein
MKYSDGIAICSGFTKNEKLKKVYEELRNESKARLWQMIRNKVSENCHYPIKHHNFLKEILKSLGNVLSDRFTRYLNESLSPPLSSSQRDNHIEYQTMSHMPSNSVSKQKIDDYDDFYIF